MSTPSASDLKLFEGVDITTSDFNHNWQKVIAYLTTNGFDLTCKSITADTYNGMPGDDFTMVAGEDITGGNAVRISAGKIHKADNTSSADS